MPKYERSSITSGQLIQAWQNDETNVSPPFERFPPKQKYHDDNRHSASPKLLYGDVAIDAVYERHSGVVNRHGPKNFIRGGPTYRRANHAHGHKLGLCKEPIHDAKVPRINLSWGNLRGVYDSVKALRRTERSIRAQRRYVRNQPHNHTSYTPVKY